jgi:serine/threonine protein kinase
MLGPKTYQDEQLRRRESLLTLSMMKHNSADIFCLCFSCCFLLAPDLAKQVGAYVKVADFGLSHILAPDETHASVRSGTPGYTAPEVMAHGRATMASDIYAIGRRCQLQRVHNLGVSACVLCCGFHCVLMMLLARACLAKCSYVGSALNDLRHAC